MNMIRQRLQSVRKYADRQAATFLYMPDKARIWEITNFNATNVIGTMPPQTATDAVLVNNTS